MELPNILNITRQFDDMVAGRDGYPETVGTAPVGVLSALGTRYLEETAPLRSGREHFTDKLPNNFSHVGLIHAILPSATIIDARRHPMDCCFSTFKQHFAEGQSFSYDLDDLGRYYRCYLSLMDHWDAVLPGKVLHVQHEDLGSRSGGPHPPPPRPLRSAVRARLPSIFTKRAAPCAPPAPSKCASRFTPPVWAIGDTSRKNFNRCSRRSAAAWSAFEQPYRTLTTHGAPRMMRQKMYGRRPGRFPLNKPPRGCFMKLRNRHSGDLNFRKMHAPLRGSAAVSQITLAVAAALAVAPPRAHALQPADVSALQEIVVTARKREENLQDVPLSIDVFTKKDLQNLGITSIDDYAQKVPSISFISTGPGTQLFVMRGVSDGSNPNYANTSSTGFFVDDMSMSFNGAQPDLHLYDVERIEILNGPQGTTFGAGAMSGAIRYITNKPDLNAFSAGVDFDGGKIQGGQNNWTYEGFVNLPIIDGVLGLRASAFSDSHGGFIDNRASNPYLGQRRRLRQFAVGAQRLQPRARGGRTRCVEGGAMGWLERQCHLQLSAPEHHRRLGRRPDPPPRTVERFGPESNNFQTKTLDFRVDGDVGIGDLVFASTYWSQPRRQWNEYSQYEQNFNAGGKNNPPTGYPGTQEGFTCLNDPYYGGAPFTGCNAPTQFY